MDSETWLYIILVGGGLLLVIATMVLVLNPPEAWVKKVFHRKPPANPNTNLGEKGK